VSPATEQAATELELRSLEDAAVAHRALPGVWASLATVQFVLQAGNFPSERWPVVSLFAAVTTAACLGGVLVVLRKNDIAPRLWRIATCVLIFAFSSAWGVFSAYTYINDGYYHWNSQLLTYCTLGMSAAGLVALTPRLRLLYLHFLPLIVPGLLTDLCAGHERYGIALMKAIYAAFLFVQGWQLNAQYRKAMEDRRMLESAKKMAEAANEAKTRFLDNINHELRTPMNGIIATTELVLETPLSREQRDLVDTARNSAMALLRLLNDLLDFSTADARRIVLDHELFDPRKLIAQTASVVQPQASRKGLALTLDLSPRLPDCMIGDPKRLRQILFNLFSNAIKFTNAGTVTVRAGVESSNQQEVRLWFAVSDTGIGIPKEKHKEIFEPFSQADLSMTRKYGGAGLGLTICAQLVELMQGQIWLESEPDRGSTFHFTAQFGKPPATAEPEGANINFPHQVLHNSL
jgi:signal transduction histidine kinase